MSAPVCVTGASGFIAAHVVRDLLERGHEVRGTVRSAAWPEKYAFLTSLPGAADRFRLAEGQLGEPGSFDKAIAGCRCVIHAASPYLVHSDDPRTDLLDPAVEGTRNVLRSCAKAGTVERVVLTSSMAAVSDEPRADHVFTEADWNDRSTLRRNPYYLSKTLAERAAWEFVEREKPGFDLVVINPYLTIGPSLGPKLNTSNAILRDILAGTYPGILALSWGFVDVRDVARAHVLAMEKREASGRHLCIGETLSMKEVVQLLAEEGWGEGRRLPTRDMTGALMRAAAVAASYAQPAGVGSYLRTHLGKVMRYDTSKIRDELGLRFRPARRSILDAVADLKRWGHLDA